MFGYTDDKILMTPNMRNLIWNDLIPSKRTVLAGAPSWWAFFNFSYQRNTIITCIGLDFTSPSIILSRFCRHSSLGGVPSYRYAAELVSTLKITRSPVRCVLHCCDKVHTQRKQKSLKTNNNLYEYHPFESIPIRSGVCCCIVTVRLGPGSLGWKKIIHAAFCEAANRPQYSHMNICLMSTRMVEQTFRKNKSTKSIEIPLWLENRHNSWFINLIRLHCSYLS